MAKVTKELIEQLIMEEVEALSEDELNEFVGAIGSMKRRAGAALAGFKRSRQVKKWEKYKGNLSAKLEQLAKMYEDAKADIAGDLQKNKDLAAFANAFTPFNNTFNAIDGHIKALKTAAGTVRKTDPEDTPVAQNTDDAAQAGREAAGEGAVEMSGPSMDDLKAEKRAALVAINKDASLSQEQKQAKAAEINNKYKDMGVTEE